ncbi:YWFCY domain-containing protein, partial [Campylobacter fetus subsp. venerealis]
GKKDDKLKLTQVLWPLICGAIIYGTSHITFYLTFTEERLSIIYMTLTALGYSLILMGGSLLSRLLKNQQNQEVFNHLNETFSQEER